MKILITNANALIKNKWTNADILIENGKIKKIGKITEQCDKLLDAQGLTVMPAFFDMHCHLRDPGYEYKEDIISGSKAAAAGGYSAVACMPNTNPVIDSSALVQYVINKSKEAFCKVYPIGAITKGQKGEELAEYGFMKQSGAVAVSDDGKPVSSGYLMKNALEYASNYNLMVISHCEDKSISQDGVVNDGYNSSISGLRGISRVAEEAMVARDIMLAESTNTTVHIAHVSTKNSVDLVRQAKKRNVNVTCETCPQYFAADDSEILNFNTNAKINPPLREKQDNIAIIEGLCDGTIDAIATDHAPHHIDDKNIEFNYASFGTIGLETAFALSYTHLVKTGKLKLEQLSQLMTDNPAKILSINPAQIAEGADADITIVDLDTQFTVGKNFVSKSKNSLFIGRELYGKIMYTLCKGKLTYQVK